MITREIAKERYFALALGLIGARRAPLGEFQRLWNEARYREAFLLVDTLIRDEGIHPNDEFKKADEDFYWLFIS